MKTTLAPVIPSEPLACHPERSEGSLARRVEPVGPQILRCAQHDIWKQFCHGTTSEAGL